jgi:hypothetical protein
MKKSLLILTLVTLVFPLAGHSEELSLEQLRAKTFKAIDQALPAGSYPQTCVLKYSIHSQSTTQKNNYKAVDRKEIMKRIESGEDLNKIMADMKPDNSKPVKHEQLTVTLKVRTGGVIREVTILDLEAAADSAATVLANRNEAMEHMQDQVCDQEAGQKAEASEAAEPTSVTELPSDTGLQNR